VNKLGLTVLFISLAAFSFGLGRYTAPHRSAPSAEQSVQAPRPREAPGADGGEALSADGELGVAVADVLDDPDLLRRVPKFIQLLEGLSPADFQQISAGYEDAFGEPGKDVRKLDMEVLLNAWSRVDPEGAFERVRGWPMYWRKEARPILMQAWAERDPGAAQRALKSLEDPTEAGAYLDALVRGWAISGKPGLEELVASSQRGSVLQKHTSILVNHRVSQQGHEAVMRWAESLPDDERPRRFKLEVFRMTATRVALRDPLQAAAWADAHRGRDYADGMSARVALVWVPEDADAAFEWLRAHPPGEERDWAVKQSFQRWLSKDRGAAGQWLREAEPGEVLEPAIDVFARSLSARAPRNAIAWAERIGDEARRQACLIAIGQAWNRRDPEGVRNWLASSELPEAVRRAVSESPERRRPRVGAPVAERPATPESDEDEPLFGNPGL
jgi:hypothetical protein